MSITERILTDLNLLDRVKEICGEDSMLSFENHIKSGGDLWGMFVFTDTEEGHEFWMDVATKIDNQI